MWGKATSFLVTVKVSFLAEPVTGRSYRTQFKGLLEKEVFKLATGGNPAKILTLAETLAVQASKEGQQLVILGLLPAPLRVRGKVKTVLLGVTALPARAYLKFESATTTLNVVVANIGFRCALALVEVVSYDGVQVLVVDMTVTKVPKALTSLLG